MRCFADPEFRHSVTLLDRDHDVAPPRPSPSRPSVDRPRRGLERPPSLAGVRPVVRRHDRALRRQPRRRRDERVEAVSNDERAKYEAGEAYVVYSDANAVGRSGGAGVAAVPAHRLERRRDRRRPRVPGRRSPTSATRLTALQSTVDGADRSGRSPTRRSDEGPAAGRPGLAGPDDRPDRRAGARATASRSPSGSSPCRPSFAEIRAAHPGLRIHALNNTLANDEISELINGGLDASLRLTIPLTFVILLIAFGAVVAALVPLVLAVTALLAAFGMLGLYSQLVTPVSPYASQLVVLIGLAVAVDYSLFMVTRFRTERRHGRAKLAAIDVASSAPPGEPCSSPGSR